MLTCVRLSRKAQTRFVGTTRAASAGNRADRFAHREQQAPGRQDTRARAERVVRDGGGMKDVRIGVVGIVKNTHPDLQIEIEQGDARDFSVYQWYGDDGPYDDWVANEDDLAHYLEETAWKIEWHPELQNAGPMELRSRFRGEEKRTGSVVVRLWDGRRPSNQPQLRGRAAWD